MYIVVMKAFCSLIQEHQEFRINFPPDMYHLYLLQLFLVCGVHLLQRLFQLMVPVEEGFPKRRCQMEICQNAGKHVSMR